jgi:predicted nucleic acid-binding protein
MIHLDTNVLIRALVQNTPHAQRVEQWLAAGEEMRISDVAWCEFLCGPVTAEQTQLAETALGPPIPFSSEDATVAARLFNLGGRRRGSMVDCMVAATSIRAASELATENVDDFMRFETHGLRLVRLT